MSKCTIKDGKYFAPNGEESLLYKNLRENMSEDEANDLFVLSKTPSFQENVVTPLIEEYRNKVSEIPENIKFKETFANKIRTFHIYDGKLKAGRIQLIAYKDGFKVKSSLVNEDQRGKGFGKYLYNYTISKLLAENNTLYTDTARTEDADRVWESLKKQGLSQDGKSVKPLPKEFDKNGEISMSTVLQYTADNFSQLLPLNAVEKSHLINLQIEGVETSDDLYNVLYDAFYKNNLFSPNINKLKKIYSEDEIRNILEDSEIQGRVKETIEKLRQTEEFTIPQIKYNKDFDVRSSKVNIIGQYKKQNPLRLEQKFKEQGYLKVPVVNEAGEQLETQMFYENAIKVPSDKAIRAVTAVVNAHPMVDTIQLENNIIKSFKKYGMDIEGLERENFKELLGYVTTPTDENRKSLEDALGFVREPLTRPINISPENRSYQYLKTAKSERELFDELSLIQTAVPNVYHKVNKIDEQEMRDIQENQDLTVPDYQLYKDYYEYTKPKLKKEIQTNVEGDIDYLLNDFIADFAVEKLKNPTEFNRQFKITSEGIELTSNDDITIAIVKAYIQDGGKYTKEIADYSLLSKEMTNLKEKSLDFITSKQDRKIQAINDINKINSFKESVTILDDDSLYAPGENAEFLKLGEDLYEQQEEGYYTKIEKNESPTLVEMSVENLKREKFEIQQEKLAENKIKKIISKEAEKENFSCI